MQYLIVLLILGSVVLRAISRPSHLMEESDSGTEQAEYEGSDDNTADEYVRDDQEPIMEEVQRKSGRQAVLQDDQDQGDIRNVDFSSDLQSARNRDRYDKFSENDSDSQKERELHENQDSSKKNEYMSRYEQPRKLQQNDDTGNLASYELYSHPKNTKIKRLQSETSLNGRSLNTDIDYGEMLFKMKSAQAKSGKQQNNEAANEQSSINRQYYNNINLRNRNAEDRRELENSYNYDRDRRHASNVEEKQISDTSSTPNEKEVADATNEISEKVIIQNIKKLSEQDLEELLNSLPEDKKALLKKIMDKREITKKAGAVDENNYMDGGQSDTSKFEGGYSINCNSESSLSSVTPETSKQPENGEVINSKTSDSESGSGASGGKSEINNNTPMKDDKPAIQEEYSNIDSKKDVNIHSEAEEAVKNENKRETDTKSLVDEKLTIEDTKISDYPLEAKSSNEFLLNQDISNVHRNWFDSVNNQPQESDIQGETYKREISQKDPSVLYDCAKSLEDSFPAANIYDNNRLESETAPLIRVKRTEKDHLKGRDVSFLSNPNVHFSSGVNSEDSVNKEKSEYGDYGASNYERSEQELEPSKILVNSDTQRHLSLDDKRSELRPAILTGVQKTQFDKLSLGGDTDSIPSNIEGIDDNLMYNNGLRGKRIPESSEANGLRNSNRFGRTTVPINIEEISDNSIKISQYKENVAFGTLPRNSEEDISRFKRVRQIKQAS